MFDDIFKKSKFPASHTIELLFVITHTEFIYVD